MTSVFGPDRFRLLLRHQVNTVAVVTAPGPPPVGITATTVTSVSLQPALVSFCLSRASSRFAALTGSEYLGVHLLSADQQQLAKAFAVSGTESFTAPTRWTPGPHGVPLIDGALAWLVCKMVRSVPVGDHAIVIAEALIGDHISDGSALVYHHGQYAQLPGS